MEMYGKYIVFEGNEGTGKDTQIELLLKFFNNNDVKYIKVKEPSNHNNFLKFLRGEIKSNKDLFEITRFLLHSAARNELIEGVVIPALKQGVNVVSNRSYVSSIVYQGLVGGIDMQFLQTNIKNCMHGIEIDYLFILQNSPQISWERIKNRSTLQKDIIESRGLNLITKIYQAYNMYAKRNPCYIIDSSKPIHIVGGEIISKLIVENSLKTKELF